jgi:cytochrome b6-f complex iron-sulfur subunit
MKKTESPEQEQERSRIDPEPMARRDFLGTAALASATAALGFGAIGALQLPKAAILPSPSKKFRAALPETMVPGTPFIPPGRSVAIMRGDKGGLYALSIVCTHLGCIVKPSETGFDCPCHGSRYKPDGTVVRGPAPKALKWLAVSSAGAGGVIVDEGTEVKPGTLVVI